MTHLWEVDHDYYGPEGSYWAGIEQRPYIQRFSSWAEFAQPGSMWDAIEGLNMLYRWDWERYDPADFLPFGDEVPGDQLKLFWMMPRKGIMATSTIEVTEADEPAVIAWLEPHARYMREMWAPLLDAPSG